ncbi:hypothetical protein [Bacillus alkalicellulosilyticus]|nr:hypothetical protein [Bacillus alkalicellulosilyticus]
MYDNQTELTALRLQPLSNLTELGRERLHQLMEEQERFKQIEGLTPSE